MYFSLLQVSEAKPVLSKIKSEVHEQSKFKQTGIFKSSKKIFKSGIRLSLESNQFCTI